MNIYNKIFINYYNFYGRIFDSSDREMSIYFITILQIFQLATLLIPFRFLGLVNWQYGKHTVGVVCVLIFIFNTFYYTKKRLVDLMNDYAKQTEKQRQTFRTMSVLIIISTILAFIISIRLLYIL
jgi:hypothetical protein